MDKPEQLRSIRSFVRREGRFTSGQQRAFDTFWERFGLDADSKLPALDAVFGRHAPHVLEIGFGDGEALAAMAHAHPETDYLGIEVHRPGVGHLLLRAQALELTNLRIICADAVEVLRWQLPDACLDHIQIFFPDPWPKKRHHKRRLIQPDFVALVARKLKSGAHLHLATDWEDYARHMLEVLQAADDFSNAGDSDHFAGRIAGRPLTKFERRGQRLGHEVRDLIFRRR
jgi:tRNA (guanine-N7-)-methyltransferase